MDYLTWIRETIFGKPALIIKLVISNDLPILPGYVVPELSFYGKTINGETAIRDIINYVDNLHRNRTLKILFDSKILIRKNTSIESKDVMRNMFRTIDVDIPIDIRSYINTIIDTLSFDNPFYVAILFDWGDRQHLTIIDNSTLYVLSSKNRNFDSR